MQRPILARLALAALLSAVTAVAIAAALPGGATTGFAVPIAPAGVSAAATGANAPIGFALFPPTNPWNADVTNAPVHPLSEAYLARMGGTTGLHPDFGTTWNGAPNGIPYVLVPGTQPRVPITFDYADESDPGPYPIPLDAPIEGGPTSAGDRHILTLDTDNRILYEVYDAHYNASAGRWEAGSGAVWHLSSNDVRPAGWTSADAAGLPILPGLVRYDEVSAGEITHALRFTVPQTQRAYVYPARHFASSSTDPVLPPMGLRLRLKAGYDISRYPSEVQVILRALKRYGMIVADNGGPFYISGAPDPRWDDDALSAISGVKGSDFEVVDANAPALVPPTVRFGRVTRVQVWRSLSQLGGFSDASGSAWSATVDYGDGGGPVRLALTADKRFRLVHQYATAGAYTVVVRVTSNRGATGAGRLGVRVSGRRR